MRSAHHRFLIVAADEADPPRFGVAAAPDLLLGGLRRAGQRLRFEQERADQTLLLRQRRKRLRREAMLEPQRRDASAQPAAKARAHVAEAAHHVAVVRHELARPRRRRVQPIDIRARGERSHALHLVEHEVRLARDPARAAQEAGDAEPLGHVLVRVPVFPLGAHLRRYVPPHGDRRASEHQRRRSSMAARSSPIGICPGAEPAAATPKLSAEPNAKPAMRLSAPCGPIETPISASASSREASSVAARSVRASSGRRAITETFATSPPSCSARRNCAASSSALGVRSKSWNEHTSPTPWRREASRTAAMPARLELISKSTRSTIPSAQTAS